MTARSILKWPNRQLFKKSVSIESFGDEAKELFDDLYDTVRVNYGAGLAAPQIGIFQRACIISDRYAPSLPKDPSYEGFVILANPELTPVGEEEFAWREACLSVDDFSAFVIRKKTMVVQYQNSLGEVISCLCEIQIIHGIVVAFVITPLL